MLTYTVPLLVVLVLMPLAPAGADPLDFSGSKVEAIGEGGALALTDGDRVCLAGIWIPETSAGQDEGGGWRAGWRRVIRETAFFSSADAADSHDRYGCARVTPKSAEGHSLQHALLENGWALVDPISALDKADGVDVMLRLEEQARAERLGIWADPASLPKGTNDLDAWIGTRQLVEGRVWRVHTNDRYTYLNFGADWRTDFTIRLDRHKFDAAGLDSERLAGRTVRARGVLQDSRGPLLDVVHLRQIEVLP